MRIWRDGVELDPGPRQQSYLLAVLLARAGRPVSTSELVDLIWGEDVPASAVNILQKYVGALRRLFEPALPVREAGSFLHRRGNAYLFAQDHEAALDHFVEALGLWHGSACDGIAEGAIATAVFAALDNEFGDPFAVSVRVFYTTMIASMAGDAETARRAGERWAAAGLARLRTQRDHYIWPCWCWARALTGEDPAAAAAEAEELLVANLLHPPQWGITYHCALLAEMWLAAGSPDRAEAALDRADQTMRDYGRQYAEGLHLLLKACLLQARGAPLTAVRAAAERAHTRSTASEAHLFARRAERLLPGFFRSLSGTPRVREPPLPRGDVIRIGQAVLGRESDTRGYRWRNVGQLLGSRPPSAGPALYRVFLGSFPSPGAPAPGSSNPRNLETSSCVPCLDARAHDSLDEAVGEVERLGRMVQGLLALARLENSATTPEPVDLDTVVADRVAMWEPLAAEQYVALAVTGRPAGRVWAIPGALEQIIDNLVANALRVSPPGTTLTLHRAPGAELHVVDQGPGMTEADRARAFDRFWRASTSHHDGTGLGLPIVRHLVHASGGDITLRPAPGPGTGLDAAVRLQPVRPRGRRNRDAPAVTGNRGRAQTWS
ncbi:ATP-binding protein [Streptomyces sp. NPDC004237]|uniref:ATP-binding protein n=1 Tax=Streptomyces sp. NPDC004237 TaxID=3154455 RepID=UPI0033BC1A2C